MSDARFVNPDYARRARVWIVVATHKPYAMPKDKMYIPLHVGAELTVNEFGEPADFGFQKDNTGDNISERNPQFCELTGLYWAWKNLQSDYKGLVHYRRHFRSISSGMKHPSSDKFDSVLKYREIRRLLGQYSVIVPRKRRYYIETLRQHYEHNHFIDELDTARDIMLEKYPEYELAYEKAINRTWGYMFNMMILRSDLMDEYCTWLFDILFELCDQMKLSDDKTAFEARFPGRVSERLFNVWLEYQIENGRISSEEIFEIPFMYTEKINIIKKGFTFLRAKFVGVKPKKSF